MCFKNMPKNVMLQSAGVNRTATAIDVHLFFLIRKLPPVLQRAIIATVFATKDIAP